MLGGQKTRFKDEEDKRDLLDGIRNHKKAIVTKKALMSKKKPGDKLQTAEAEEASDIPVEGEAAAGDT